MCACVFVRVCVLVKVWTCTREYLCACALSFVRICVRVRLLAFARECAEGVCASVYVSVCVYVRMHVCARPCVCAEYVCSRVKVRVRVTAPA
jgi:hypothetical protein